MFFLGSFYFCAPENCVNKLIKKNITNRLYRVNEYEWLEQKKSNEKSPVSTFKIVCFQFYSIVVSYECTYESSCAPFSTYKNNWSDNVSPPIQHNEHIDMILPVWRRALVLFVICSQVPCWDKSISEFADRHIVFPIC